VFFNDCNILSLTFYYRQDAAKWQTAGIKFTHRPKISIFAPTGATLCTDSREIWHDHGARGSTWPHEISWQSVHGDGNAAPKYQKFPPLVKSCLTGLSYISDSNLTWFFSQVTELLLRNRVSVI